jgi:hypothetical protein
LKFVSKANKANTFFCTHNERAFSGPNFDQPVFHKRSKGFANDGSADPKVACQFVLARETVTVLE